MGKRLLVVACALALLLAGCKVDTTVTIKVNEDGSGVVTVTAVLDADAVKAAEARGGKLEDRIRLADLTRAGWTLQPWARAADGSAQIQFSKPFRSPSEVAGIVAELNGKVGPLRDVTVARDQGVFSTTYTATGTIDLAQLQTGLAGDPEVVAGLTNQRVDVTAVDQSLLAEIRDSFALKVDVELPNGTTTVAGVGGKTTAIDASTSVLDTQRVVLVAVASVLVVLAVIVLLWPGRRRRRRATRGRGATEGTPPASRTRSSRPRRAAPPPSAGPS
jgi:hypothetical protein